MNNKENAVNHEINIDIDIDICNVLYTQYLYRVEILPLLLVL